MGAALTGPRVLAAVLAVAIAFLSGLGILGARMMPVTAELTRVTGRAETFRRGQMRWIPATAATTLSDGDEIRTSPGGSVEIALPDSSVVLVAENSRVVIVGLELDAEARRRTALFHVAVGKMCATVAPVATAPVPARESTFAISTPTSVATTRGPTIMVVRYDQARNSTALAVLPDPARPDAVEAIEIGRASGTRVSVGVGSFVTRTGPMPPSAPSPIAGPMEPARVRLCGRSNPETEGQPPLLATTADMPDADQVIRLIGRRFLIEPPPLPVPPSSVGRDLQGRDLQTCASPPCP